MSLSRLRVTKLRNIDVAQFTPSPCINIIIGQNGSGKTSLLEAVYVLGLARSFRSARLKPIVQEGFEEFTVFGEVSVKSHSHRVGVKRDVSGGGQIRIDGESIPTASRLAELLPVQLITPDSFSLLTGGPKLRRQFLDWGVFHVERGFLKAWKNYQSVLKQRNHLLRRGKILRNELAVWDKALIEYALIINEFRLDYFNRFVPLFHDVLDRFGMADVANAIKLSYFRGWDKEQEFADALGSAIDKDMGSGFTHFGPHRADLRVHIGRANAADRLSRGQQKLVVCALKLSQGILYQHLTGRKCVFLVDDLAAELDMQHRSTLCAVLEKMDCQVFITCIEHDALSGLWPESTNIKMFHVEHGKVTELPG